MKKYYKLEKIMKNMFSNNQNNNIPERINYYISQGTHNSLRIANIGMSLMLGYTNQNPLLNIGLGMDIINNSIKHRLEHKLDHDESIIIEGISKPVTLSTLSYFVGQSFRYIL